jgi:hypothetical protein
MTAYPRLKGHVYRIIKRWDVPEICEGRPIRRGRFDITHADGAIEKVDRPDGPHTLTSVECSELSWVLNALVGALRGSGDTISTSTNAHHDEQRTSNSTVQPNRGQAVVDVDTKVEIDPSPSEWRSPSRKVICPLHGIRTDAAWQRGLADLATLHGWVCRLERWSYDRFPIRAFLTPWTREAMLGWLRRHYDAEIHDRRLSTEAGRLPSVVAHSFGT